MRVLDPQVTPQNRLLGGDLNFQTPQILTRLCQPPKGILLRGIRIAAAGCGTPCGAQRSRAHTHADTRRAVRLYRAAFCAAHSLIRGSTNQLFSPGIPPLTNHFPWRGWGGNPCTPTILHSEVVPASRLLPSWASESLSLEGACAACTFPHAPQVHPDAPQVNAFSLSAF